MKIYLDDLRSAPDGWTRIDNVAEVKKFLQDGVVDELSLDNDLAGACKNDCWEEIIDGKNVMIDMVCVSGKYPSLCMCNCHIEGIELVLWMYEEGIWPRIKPIVHSANVVRAPRMREIIDEHWRGIEDN